MRDSVSMPAVIGANGAVWKGLTQICGQVLDLLARGTIDDAAARLFRQPVQQGLVFFQVEIDAAARINEVGAIESGDVHYLGAAQV